MVKPKVFVGSSSEAKNVLRAIDTNLNDVAELIPWDHPDVFQLGYGNLENLFNILESCDFAILVLSGDDFVTSRNVSSVSPRDNIIFELGLFMGRLGRDKVFAVYSKEDSPKIPSDFAGITCGTYDASSRADLATLNSALRPACNLIRLRIEKFQDPAAVALYPLLKPVAGEFKDIRLRLNQIIEGTNHLRESDSFIGNELLQRVVADALRQLARGSERIQEGYAVPASQYPYHLISLQKEFHPCVRALALVDQQERFWQQEAGWEILETSGRDNQRVFVFVNEEDFYKNYDTLLKHASNYKVRAMSLERLAREFYPHNRDFALIQTPDNKLLAAYDRKTSFRTIRFITDEKIISEHERVYNKIYRAATDINSKAVEGRDRICLRIFGQRPVTQRTVEMSDYISIDAYDLHEEEHAYYEEMMSKMIEIFKQERERDNSAEPCKVLELGAGTGIFTKRLAAQPDVEVEAIELDWACFKKLLYNMQQAEFKNVKCMNEDSRSYDAGGKEGKYKYIFSSFADHHIKDEDKMQYFQNVKENLEPGGFFIVGDEFLPPHERDDPQARRAALEAYHQHIIDIAEKKGQTILVALEQEALKSGLEEYGDFKLSCEQYENLLREAQFAFRRPFKIGPEGRDDVGGVFVYEIWVP